MARFQYEIIRVPPFHYLHVLDNNANVVRVVEGPSRYTCLGHEKVILGPEPMYAPLSSPPGLLSLLLVSLKSHHHLMRVCVQDRGAAPTLRHHRKPRPQGWCDNTHTAARAHARARPHTHDHTHDKCESAD